MSTARNTDADGEKSGHESTLSIRLPLSLSISPSFSGAANTSGGELRKNLLKYIQEVRSVKVCHFA